MKTIDITSKREYGKALIDSLFSDRVDTVSINIERLDKAKYKWLGSVKAYKGQWVEVPDSVSHCWPVRKVDSGGVYMALYCA